MVIEDIWLLWNLFEDRLVNKTSAPTLNFEHFLPSPLLCKMPLNLNGKNGVLEHSGCIVHAVWCQLYQPKKLETKCYINLGSFYQTLVRCRHMFITHLFYINLGEFFYDSLEVQTYLYDTLYITNPLFGKGKSQKLVPNSFLHMAGLYDGVCVPKPSDLGLRFWKFLAWKLDIEHLQHQNFQQRTKSWSCDLQDSVQDTRKWVKTSLPQTYLSQRCCCELALLLLLWLLLSIFCRC